MALKRFNYKDLLEFLKDDDHEFDVRNSIGASFMVTVTHKENQAGQIRANITEFGPLEGEEGQEEIPF